MKKNNIAKFILLGFLSLHTCTLKAQDTLYNRSLGLAVKTDILSTALAGPLSQSQSYSLSVEKLIGKKQSFQLSGYFNYFNYNSYAPYTKYRSFQIIPEYRFYLNTKKLQKGIYCGIYSGLIARHELFPRDNSEHIQRFIEQGVLGGYQIYLFKHFVVDFLFGLGINKNIYNKKINDRDQFNVNVDQRLYLDSRLSLNIGYIFY